MDDDAYLALADQRRRGVLLALLDESVIPVEELADDTGDPIGRITLHHQHLPLLEQMGYVSWERAAERVVRGPAFDEIRPLVKFHAAAISDEGGVTETETVD